MPSRNRGGRVGGQAEAPASQDGELLAWMPDRTVALVDFETEIERGQGSTVSFPPQGIKPRFTRRPVFFLYHHLLCRRGAFPFPPGLIRSAAVETVYRYALLQTLAA